MVKNYTDPIQFLWKEVKVIVDRPLWSTHPRIESIYYKQNYWYIPNTLSPDWEELDAYVLLEDKPLKEFIWICIAVIHRLNDNEDKLVIVKKWEKLSQNEIRKLTNFQEKYFKSIIINLWTKL